MNKLLITGFFLITSPVFAKLILQDAQTREICHDMQATLMPIPNVRVKVETEERSDPKGRVLLKISSNGKGTFHFKELYKSGYVLISPTAEDVASQRLFPLNPKAPIDIILADKMELEKQKEKIASRYLENYETRIHELEQQLEGETDQAKRDTLSNKLQELYDQYETIIVRINQEAEKLSRIDYLSLDEASRKSIELRKQGKADALISHNLSQLPDDHEAQSRAMQHVIKTSQQEINEKKALAAHWGQLYHNIAYGHQMKFNYREVAQWLKKCCDIDTQNYIYKIEYADLLSNYLSNHKEALALYEHALMLVKEQFGENSKQAADIYTAMSECYIKLLMPEEALKCIKQAQIITENLSSYKHPFGAIVYNNNLAGVYFAQGKYDQALDLYFQAIGPFEMHFGTSHPSVLTCYHNIGVACAALNQFDNALRYFTKLDRLYGKQQPKHNLSIAQNRICIALMHEKLNDYASALDHLGKAQSLIEAHAATHPAKGVALYHMGRIWQLKGDQTKATSYYLMANELFDSLTAHRHREGIDVGISLGILYEQANEFDKALDVYLRKLTQCDRILGEYHVTTAILHSHIAHTYQSKGDTAQALSHYKESLAILNEIYDGAHLATASCLMDLGQLSTELGKYDDALRYYYNALIMRFIASPEDKQLMAESYKGIAASYFHLEKYEQALATYDKAIGTSEPVYKENHPFILECYRNKAFIHYVQADYEKALALYTKILSLTDSNLDHGKVNRLLGLVYQKKKNYPQALSHFERALSLFSNIGDKMTDEIIYTRYNLGMIYMLMKNSEKAHSYLSQAHEDAVQQFGADGSATRIIKQSLEQINAQQER